MKLLRFYFFMIGIYKITSPTGRVYIGQSINIQKRLAQYKYGCKSQPKLNRSFKKHLYHVYEIIEECEINELNNRERYWQEFYNCVEDGLNCMLSTSDNCPSKRSKETRDKISNFNKLRGPLPQWWKNNISKGRTGIKFSKSHCKNISISKTGSNNVVSKKVINVLTGVIYDSINEAAKNNNTNQKLLSRYLTGKRTNKLPHLKYV